MSRPLRSGADSGSIAEIVTEKLVASRDGSALVQTLPVLCEALGFSSAVLIKRTSIATAEERGGLRRGLRENPIQDITPLYTLGRI